MNNSLTSFNQTQYKSTFKSAPLDYSTNNIKSKLYGNDYYNTTNVATLKGKVQNLEDKLYSTLNEFDGYIADVKGLKTEKESLEFTLDHKTQELENSLLKELENFENDINKHFSDKIAENQRMVNQISSLKNEKNLLMSQLIALQRRLADLEQKIGGDYFK